MISGSDGHQEHNKGGNDREQPAGAGGGWRGEGGTTLAWEIRAGRLEEVGSEQTKRRGGNDPHGSTWISGERTLKAGGTKLDIF